MCSGKIYSTRGTAAAAAGSGGGGDGVRPGTVAVPRSARLKFTTWPTFGAAVGFTCALPAKNNRCWAKGTAVKTFLAVLKSFTRVKRTDSSSFARKEKFLQHTTLLLLHHSSAFRHTTFKSLAFLTNQILGFEHATYHTTTAPAYCAPP